MASRSVRTSVEAPALQRGVERPLTLYLVKRLQLVIQGVVDSALRELDVTPLQFTILSVIRDGGPKTSASLAREAFVKPQTMHEIVLSLEKRGYVAKEPDPGSKRSLLVVTTPLADDLLTRCTPAVEELERVVLDALSPAQAAMFRELLETTAEAMTAEAKRRHVEGVRDLLPEGSHGPSGCSEMCG